MKKLNRSDNGPQVQARVETVTPLQAKVWLEQYNVRNNRNVMPSRVARWRSEMKAGAWQIGQPIMFDHDGILIDGQHRLTALVQEEIALDFLVVRGMDPKVLPVLDTGAPRTAANIAKIAGTDFKPKHIACLRAMFLAPGLGDHVVSKISSRRIVELLDECSEAIMFVCEGSYTSGKSEGRLMTGVVDGVAARAYYHENHKRIAEFLECFRSGFVQTHSRDDSAAIALRNRYLQSRPFFGNSKSMARAELFLLTQKALRKFLQGEKVATLRNPTENESVNYWVVPAIDGE